MDMDFVTTLLNYGAMGVCLAYFIWKDNTTMKDFRTSLDTLKDAINIMQAKQDNKD